MDGESLYTAAELSKIKALDLVQATPLRDSYVLLEYECAIEQTTIQWMLTDL